MGVLASGQGTNLQALIDQLHGREIVIVGVCTNRADVQAIDRARRAGIESAVFELESFTTGATSVRASRDAAMAQWLVARNAELIVCAGYMHLLTRPFLTSFDGLIVNVHPSLLPAFPGLRPIEDAVAAGVDETGVTVHLVDSGIDTGRVLVQERMAVHYDESTETLRERIHAVEHRLLPETVRAIANGRIEVPGGAGR